MTEVILSILLFILLLPFILLVTVGLIANFTSEPYKVIDNSDLPESEKAKAVDCLLQVRRKGLSGLLYDATAPYVMLLVLPFVKRSATTLPKLFTKWDNEVSINGDGWGKKLPDGNWVTIREPGDPDCIPYDHPDYEGDAYYCKGHNPKSFIARYVWLGWRNRASKLAYMQGEVITAEDKLNVKTYGNPEVDNGKDGWLIREVRGLYEVYQNTTGNSFIKRTRYGYKIGNAIRYGADKAMIATVGVSYKKNKNKRLE